MSVCVQYYGIYFCLKFDAEISNEPSPNSPLTQQYVNIGPGRTKREEKRIGKPPDSEDDEYETFQ